MKDYGKLVREAIRKAHEEAEAAKRVAENKMATFEVGKTYSDNFICSHDTYYFVKILKRTEKTVTIEKDGKVKRCKLYTSSKEEYIYPFGQYSMCPVLGARDLVA